MTDILHFNTQVNKEIHYFHIQCLHSKLKQLAVWQEGWSRLSVVEPTTCQFACHRDKRQHAAIMLLRPPSGRDTYPLDIMWYCACRKRFRYPSLTPLESSHSHQTCCVFGVVAVDPYFALKDATG